MNKKEITIKVIIFISGTLGALLLPPAHSLTARFIVGGRKDRAVNSRRQGAQSPPQHSHSPNLPNVSAHTSFQSFNHSFGGQP